MKRFLYLFAAVAVALPLYAQNCPELSCVEGLTVTILPQPSGECRLALSAFHLVESDYSGCPNPVETALYRRSEVLAAGDQFIPDFQERDTLLLNQSDDLTLIVDVYFRDGSEIIQSCESYILVNRHWQCEPDIDPIAGAISTYAGDAISDVEVIISGDLEATHITGEDGNYLLLPYWQLGNNYAITPQRNDNPLNGVSTFDIVLIRKYILGTLAFDDPYRLIAADVNQSGSVTILDAIHMRKLILGQYTTFPNSPSWRFIPANYTFPVPTNPWHEEFPTNTVFTPLSVDISGINFIGVKVGDVNGSAQAN